MSGMTIMKLCVLTFFILMGTFVVATLVAFMIIPGKLDYTLIYACSAIVSAWATAIAALVMYLITRKSAK